MSLRHPVTPQFIPFLNKDGGTVPTVVTITIAVEI
jgi:hypothetical protein